MLLRKHKPPRAILSFVVLAAIGLPAWAQSGLVAPRATATPQPPQPTNAQGEPVEGWISLRYTVRDDGTPTDIRAIDVMPPSIDPAATIEAVGNWTFSPGTRDGEAIDWFNNETIVVFNSEDVPSEPSQAFVDGYQAIVGMIQEKNFDAAIPLSRKLIDEQAKRLEDIGVALAQSAFVYFGNGDFHAALHPIQQASDPRVPLLGGDDLFGALQIRMQVEQALGRSAEALQTYERLNTALGPNADDLGPTFVTIGEKLRDAVANAQYLPVAARVDDRPWRIDAERRFFYIEDIEGEIQTIDAECDTRKISLAFNPEDNYGLPDSFGDCVVFVHGDPGTEFTFVQVLPPSDG